MAWANKSGKLLHDSKTCVVAEESYSPKTLQGNWYEERCDTKTVLEPKPLPSQRAHYYQTTYAAAYNREEKVPTRTTLEREPHIYPGHQPELDPPETKFIPKTCYMIDYVAPKQKHRALLAAMRGRAEETVEPEERGFTKASAMAAFRAGSAVPQPKWGPAGNRNIPQTTYMVDYVAPSERRKALRAFLDKTEGGTKDPQAEDKLSKSAAVSPFKVPPVFKKEPPIFSRYRPEPGPPKIQFVHKSCYMQDYVAPNLRI
ncbi:cilia- and flagella-associated protein 68 [Microcaecilia unicolor]|uniref:UPF0686 protein C11orf1 homolog n=1 Tax=Microcaecilia unicolor TaxID=1415580 RepID=A0A6P7ZB88_9AMPH|nr:UPF0686 protein C11orf1 homolog [Microcaecilia unicolor]